MGIFWYSLKTVIIWIMDYNEKTALLFDVRQYPFIPGRNNFIFNIVVGINSNFTVKR
jgi:hypothetical protein